MSDVDVCLACDYGRPEAEDPEELQDLLFGFCPVCQKTGRAEFYLSLLAVQDGDLEEAYTLFKKAREKGLGK